MMATPSSPGHSTVFVTLKVRVAFAIYSLVHSAALEQVAAFYRATWWPFGLQLRPKLKEVFKKMFMSLAPAST